jgi:GR25 family glycosyltransferase involved in LPS biosynthesis
LPEKPHRTEAAQKHFDEVGLDCVRFIPGINGEKFGLRTIHPYAVDDPSGKFFCGPHETGIFLSHLFVWMHVSLSHDYAMVMEDDVKFRDGWKQQVRDALANVPENFDFLFLGSCATGAAFKQHVKGNVWDVRYPACFHAYIVSQRGAAYLVQTQRKMWGPVDLMTWVVDPRGGSIPSFRDLNVYTVMPRVADQFNTELCD